MNLKAETRTKAQAAAKDVQEQLELAQLRMEAGQIVKVPKVAKPFELFSPDNNVPLDPVPFADDGLSTAPEPAAPPTPGDGVSGGKRSTGPKPATKKSTSRETWRETRERLNNDNMQNLEFPKALGDAWKGFESYPQGIGAAYFQMAAYHGLIDDTNKAAAQIRHSLFGQATWELIHADDLGRCMMLYVPKLNVAQIAGRYGGSKFTNWALFRKLGPKGSVAAKLSTFVLAGYGSAILAIEDNKSSALNVLSAFITGDPDVGNGYNSMTEEQKNACLSSEKGLKEWLLIKNGLIGSREMYYGE